MNRTSMLYWWPRVRDLDIPMPRTEIVLEKGMFDWIEILDQPMDSSEQEYLADKARQFGYPFFMRTDLSSGKHDYKYTCYVTSQENICPNLCRLVDISFAYDIGINALVFREYLYLEHMFRAFDGLPIAPERRYFAEDGEVYCHHPYWPEDAIKFVKNKPPAKWKNNLKLMNREESGEVMLLTEYAKELSDRLDGAWSFDFARGQDGNWYFIDAAEAAKSWIHPDYISMVDGI